MKRCNCNDCKRVRERNKPGRTWGTPKESNRKTIAVFIAEHREELDECILKRVPNAKLNNEERRKWILNDEGLYQWARSEGVRI